MSNKLFAEFAKFAVSERRQLMVKLGILFMMSFIMLSFISSETVAKQSIIKIAIYTDEGTLANCIKKSLDIVRAEKDMTIDKLLQSDIASGKLAQYDVLLLPGGSGSGEAESLKQEGRQAVIIRDILGRQEIWGHKIDIQLSEAFAIRPMITMDEYFGLTSTLLLLFGAVFELPLVLTILSLLGLVTPRGLWRFNRYAIIIFFVAGAVLTPGDIIVGQIAMAGSLTVLYNLSIAVTLLVKRRQRRQVSAPGE